MQNEKLWTFCKVAVGLLIMLTFSPLVTPSGVYEPTFMGIPYTLWMGIIVAFLLVGITWIGTRVHPGREE